MSIYELTSECFCYNVRGNKYYYHCYAKTKNLGILTKIPKTAKYIMDKLKQTLPVHAKCTCVCII